MKIIVDTNIVFSALLNTNSKIAYVLLQPHSKFKFYTTDQLNLEIQENKQKIKQLTNFTETELSRMIYLVTKRITFINVQLIPNEVYKRCELLTKDVDIDDCEFVALTEFIDGRLWSGDKTLKRGLAKRNWNKFIDTNKLFEIIIAKKT